MITGGTGGLGRATVELLAARGDTVLTCGRNEAKVRALNDIPGVTATVVDVSSPEEVAAWAASAPSVVDVLLNNAGVLRIGDPAAAITRGAFDHVMDTNFRGPVAVTAAFWSKLPRSKKKGGRVINVGSTTETPKLSQAFHWIYSASKGALRTYSTALRQEGALVGVRVVHIKAGAFASALHSAFSSAGATLAAYPAFARHADALETGIMKKLGLVREAPAERFAEMMWAIAHAPADELAAEYWFNVSWLEWLAEQLPQWLLDRTVMSDYVP